MADIEDIDTRGGCDHDWVPYELQQRYKKSLTTQTVCCVVCGHVRELEAEQ